MIEIQASGKMKIVLRNGMLYIMANAEDMESHQDSTALMKLIRELGGKTLKIEFGQVSDFVLTAHSKIQQ